jgi:hypothetical protein
MSTIGTNPGDFKPRNHENCAFSSVGVGFTLLPDLHARTKRYVWDETIERFGAQCRGTIRASKADLPLACLAKFGNEPTEKDCLRHAANVIALTGCCGDYDGPRNGAAPITLRAAVAIATGAQLEAVISETPSSTPEAPRWRVWCPTSGEYQDALRETLALFVARLNGLFGGQLAPESYRLAQAFFIGGIEGKPTPQVAVVKGTRINLRTDLDASAIYANGNAEPPNYSAESDIPEDLAESDDDPWLLREGRRRKAGSLRREAKADNPTATGDRAFRLVMWLADMRTPDGLILSPKGIKAILGDDDFPNTTIACIRSMLSQRRKPRGWDEI